MNTILNTTSNPIVEGAFYIVAYVDRGREYIHSIEPEWGGGFTDYPFARTVPGVSGSGGQHFPPQRFESAADLVAFLERQPGCGSVEGQIVAAWF